MRLEHLISREYKIALAFQGFKLAEGDDQRGGGRYRMKSTKLTGEGITVHDLLTHDDAVRHHDYLLPRKDPLQVFDHTRGDGDHAVDIPQGQPMKGFHREHHVPSNDKLSFCGACRDGRCEVVASDMGV